MRAFIFTRVLYALNFRKRYVSHPAEALKLPLARPERRRQPTPRARCSRSRSTWPSPGAASESSVPTWFSSPSSSPCGLHCPILAVPRVSTGQSPLTYSFFHASRGPPRPASEAARPRPTRKMRRTMRRWIYLGLPRAGRDSLTFSSFPLSFLFG